AQILFDDFRHRTGSDRAAAFADREFGSLFDGDRSDQFHFQGDVVAGHHHFSAFRQLDDTGHVGGAEVELGTITVEERGVTSALFLGQAVDLSGELGVLLNAAGLGQHLSALHFFPLDPAEQDTDVVAGLGLVKQLPEHFHPGDNRFLRFFVQADDFHFVPDFDGSAFHTTRGHRTAPGDGKHVFHRHHEGLVDIPLGRRNVFVHDLHQLADAVGPFAFRVFQGFEGGTLDDRHFVAGEIIFGEQVPHFHFNQLEQFFVVHHVHLVQEDDDVGNAHLAGKQDVLPGLRHRTVSGGNDEDRSVHLGSPGDHVFHVVGVTRAVHVSIVTIFGFILDVGGGDGDPPLFFFRRL